MCEHEAIKEANGNPIIVQMETQGEGNTWVGEKIRFPARICSKCRSIFVPTTVSKSFELKGSPEGHLTR